MADPTWILGLAVAAGAVTLLGGVLPILGRQISQERIHLLLGLTAGLLLTIALVDLVPEAIEAEHDAPWTMVGALLVLLAVKAFWGDAHHHDHGEASDGTVHAASFAHTEHLAWVALFALAFHRFIDGLVLPAAFAGDTATGIAAAGGILVHQLPDGIAGASLFLAAGWQRRSVVLGVAALAACAPLGALLGLYLSGISALLGHLIALAAATFIFLALAELLPELQSRRYRWLVLAGLVLGTLAQVSIELLAGHA